MYKEHDLFKSPSDSDALWRYMDFTKFLYLLESSSLYFCRADKFEDVFEGRHPKFSVQMFLSSYRQQVRSNGVPDDVADIAAKSTVDSLASARSIVGINCWHKNEYESAAMWRLYLSSKEGVAIKTTFGGLKQSIIDESQEVNVGVVDYIDYEKTHIDFVNGFSPFLHKRLSFEHEKEVRAIVWRSDLHNASQETIDERFPGGMSIKCDLSTLVEQVYVSPAAPRWFKDLVASVLSKFDIHAPVHQSRLDETY